MASQTDTINNQTLVSNLDDKSSSSKVPSKGLKLKLNMEEFLEKKRLEDAGDVVGVEDLEKKVRQRMELELVSDPTKTATTSIGSKKTSTSKQAKSTAAASTSNSNGNFSVKNDKNIAINHKRTEITSKNGNMVRNEDRKVAVKKVKAITTTTLKSTSEILTNNKEKHKEKSKFSASTTKINHESNKGKTATIRQENSTSTSKSTNGILLNNKGRQAVINKGKTGIKVSSSTSGLVTSKSTLKLEKYIERWKSCRERGEKYEPLELFLPREILNDKNMKVTVEKIAKEFELERLRRLLEQDKNKPNGNKRLAQKRIENFNNFGKIYTRLEIAAARNEEGPKKDQQIRAHIAFLNEKNIIKHKVTPLDVIENPYYLRKGLEQFQKFLQRKEMEKPKDLERKRKLEGTWEFKRQEKSDEERKHKRQQKLEVERKSEKLEGKFAEQRRHVTKTNSRQEIERERARKAEVRHRHNRIEDLRNPPRKITTSEALKSTSLKKRTFDERSEASPSSRAPKRRNFGGGELDICGLDEETVNRNMSSIIHSIVRPGRRPIYGMDDHDDDAMEVSGFEVFREEARSSRLARKEDEDEERAEHQRRIKKLNRKKV